MSEQDDMSIDDARVQAVCPKCRRPKMPQAINLLDLPKYCWHEGDLACVEAQLAIAHNELNAHKAAPA